MNNLNIAPPKHYLEAVKLNSLSYNEYDKKFITRRKDKLVHKFNYLNLK